MNFRMRRYRGEPDEYKFWPEDSREPKEWRHYDELDEHEQRAVLGMMYG